MEDNSQNEAFIKEALEKIFSLLEGLDEESLLQLLNVGRLQFARRRFLKTEWCALCIALWRLALNKSFPNDADRMFRMFFERFQTLHSEKENLAILERIVAYWTRLKEKGDSDFRQIGEYLCTFLTEENTHVPEMTLRMVLLVRKTYNLIFTRLI